MASWTASSPPAAAAAAASGMAVTWHRLSAGTRRPPETVEQSFGPYMDHAHSDTRHIHHRPTVRLFQQFHAATEWAGSTAWRWHISILFTRCQRRPHKLDNDQCFLVSCFNFSFSFSFSHSNITPKWMRSYHIAFTQVNHTLNNWCQYCYNIATEFDAITQYAVRTAVGWARAFSR